MNDRNKSHLTDFFLYIGGILAVIIILIFLFFSENTIIDTPQPFQQTATDSSTVKTDQKEATDSVSK